MRSILLITIMPFIFGCSPGVFSPERSTVEEPAVVSIPDGPHAVDNYIIKLVDRDGKCVLEYKDKGPGTEAPSIMDINMAAPCHFIRNPKTLVPIQHTSKQGGNHRQVMLITGGAPDPDAPNANDPFQPNGCGTWQAKIRIYKDRIELVWSVFNGPAWCPSAGADEIFFAA